MRIGLDSYTYHRLLGELRPGETDPGERLADGGVAVVEEARALGVQGISLETCYLEPPGRLDGTALRDAAGALELLFSWGAPNGLEFGRNEQAFADLLEWIDLAASLDCELVRIVVGGPSLRRAEPLERQVARTVGPLERACAHARARGLVLALENHGDLEARAIRELIGRVGDPALGVCFDTANAPRVGDDPVEAARLLGPWVRMVHLKDIEPVENAADPVAGPRSVPYGEGVIPLEAVLATLAEVGFDGLVCVELAQLGPGDDERALAAACVRWLRERGLE